MHPHKSTLHQQEITISVLQRDQKDPQSFHFCLFQKWLPMTVNKANVGQVDFTFRH